MVIAKRTEYRFFDVFFVENRNQLTNSLNPLKIKDVSMSHKEPYTCTRSFFDTILKKARFYLT